MIKDLPIRSYAHVGDAVYEVFIREKTVFRTANPANLHKITIALVNGEFQACLLDKMQDFLSEDEKDIARRARNLPVTTARRTNHKIHRLSTAFEAVVGYLYLNNPERLQKLYAFLTPIIEEKIPESD